MNGGAAAPPVGVPVAVVELAASGPAPGVALAEPPEPAALVAAAERRGVARVQITVRLPDGVRTAALPVPELHYLGPDGNALPLAACDGPGEPSPLELASTAPVLRTGAAAVVSRTFAVERPGRYAAAWRLWLQVPGTRTWRVQRGRGPELTVSERDAEREIVIRPGVAELAIEPSLDTRAPGARYRFTEKDGD